MSQIAILFRRDRVWLTAFVSVLLASIVVGLVLQATRTFNATAFTVAEMTNTGAPTATVAIGETDVPIMNVVLPAPASDTLVHNGAAASTAGATFATFDAAEQFSDDDHDNAQDYVDGALIVNSADTTITSGEVVTAGTADLTAFDLAEPGMEVFADTQTDNNTFDVNEDTYREVHNGGDVFANDGTSLLEDFPDAVKFYDSNTLGDDNLYDDGEAIIADADADGRPSSGDSVTVSGDAGVAELVAGDNVFFDGSVVDDAEYDAGEVIWYDANNNDVFDSTTDVILVGGLAPALTQTEFGTEQEVAYLDDNADGIYGCVRAVQCEGIVYSGATGVNFDDDGDDLPTTTTFFDSSTEGTDGIATTGNGWDEPGGSEDLNAFAATDFYIVTVADAAYAATSDIFSLIHNGSQASGDGNEIRTMGGNDKFSDADNDGIYDDGELIASSADANLSGSEIVVSGTVDVTGFNSSATPYFKYVDDADSTYEDGEDIYQDDDISGYLNADQLTGITVKNTGTALDADIDELGVWIDDGDGTFESGEDNQVLTDVDGTYFDSQEAITGTVFTAAQRIFVTVNIDAAGGGDGDPTNGVTIIAQLTDGAAGGDGDCDNSSTDEAACAVLLASNDDGPTDGNVTNGNTITVDAVVPTPTAANISVTLVTEVTVDGIAAVGDNVKFVWDAATDGYADMASASIDLSQFGGGVASMAEDDGGPNDCDGDLGADANIFCYTITISAGAIDDANNNALVTGTDDAGNVSAAVTDNGNTTVDNQVPVVTDAAISIDGESGTGGAYKISDVVTATWNNVTDANADETTVTVNYTEFGGGAAVAAADGDANETWVATYTIVDDATNIDDADNNVSVTVTDDAGNATTTADGTTYTVDNVDPIIVAASLGIDDTACTGTGTYCIVGDDLTFTWDAAGDGNSDTFADVSVDLSNYGGDVNTTMYDDGTNGDAIGADDVWTITYALTEDPIDSADITADGMTVIDNAGNVNNSGASTDSADLDLILPEFSSVSIQDSNTNGVIDTIAIVFSEAIADSAAGANGFNVTSAANHGSCTSESIDPNGTASRNLTVTCTSARTAVGDMSIAFTAGATMVDDAGNQLASVTMTVAPGVGPAITDDADPVVMSVDPTDGSEGEATDSDLVITFSEPMDTTFAEGTEFTVTPDDTSWTSAATVSNTVITLSHGNEFNCNNTYSAALDETEIDSANAEALITTGPSDGTWSFETRSCGGGGGGGGGSSSATSTTPIVTLTNPDDGDSLDGGEDVTVTWQTSGSGHDTISLAYSTNAGLTYTEIAYNVDEDEGSYEWTVPDVDATDALVKITSYDSGKGTLDTDTVTVDIVASAGAEEEEGTEEETTQGAEWDEAEDRYVAPGSGEYGDSPLDGSEEEISEVSAGWFVRAYGYSSVYYVDENHNRRVFWDTNTFFTWADSWDDVVWVTDATLPTLDMGDAMLPQPGVVLVKIQSDSKVYAIDVDTDGTYVLRWIPSEDVAISLYGSAWADYVIDLDSTIFSKFGTGDDMTEDDDVDTSVMKTRVELAELAM